MTTSLYILTGASRGMGLALAEQLLQAGNTLLTLQRSPHPDLPALAEARGARLLSWSVDLADSTGAAHELGLGLAHQGPAGLPGGGPVNNAGVNPAIAPVVDSSPELVA